MVVAPEIKNYSQLDGASSFTLISGTESVPAPKAYVPSVTAFLSREKLGKPFLVATIIVLINVLLLRACIELPSLEASREHLLGFLFDGVAFASIPLAIWCMLPILRRARRLFHSGLFSYDFCFVAVNILTIIYAFAAVFLYRTEYTKLSFAYNPTFLVLTTALLWNLIIWATERATNLGEVNWFSSAKKVCLVKEGEEIQTTSDRCKVGDILRVSKGERITNDGIVLDGVAEVDELRLSAYPERQLKVRGSEVFAGSLLVSGKIDYRIHSEFKDSQLSFFFDHLESVNIKEDELDKEMLQLSSGVSIGIVAGALLGACVVLFQGASPLMACFTATAILFAVMVPLAISFAAIARKIGRKRCFFSGAFCKTLKLFSLLAKGTNFVIDPEEHEFQVKRTAQSFDLLDDRLDKSAVSSLIVSLLAGIREEKLESLCAAIYQICDRERLQQVTRRTVYGSSGVIGEIEGVVFAFGDESFLISQGIVFQSSDISPNHPQQQQYFLSLNKDVIARVLISEVNEFSYDKIVEKLRNFKVRSTMLSTRSQDWADNFGKMLGLELSQVFGGLSKEKITEKLDGLESYAHLTFNPKPQFKESSKAIGIAFFNELLWELDRADVTLLRSSPLAIVDLFKISREHRILFQVLTYAAAALSATIYILTLMQVVTPLEVAVSLAVFILLTLGTLWGWSRNLSL